MTKQINSRELALKILYQINEEGAYANLALDKALFSCVGLDARDKGFITELVYGSVKYRGRLDYVLNQFAKTKVKKNGRLDPQHFADGRISDFATG